MNIAEGTNEKLPATPIATPILHAYIMPDRNLGLVFHRLRHARTRAFAMYVRRCSSLLTRLRVIPIPQFNLVLFLRLPARIALGLVLGRPVLAPGSHFVALVRGDVSASAAERCEFRALGRGDFVA